MKKHVKTHLLLDSSYIECSECLRAELESKIDTLYSENSFAEYAARCAGFMETGQQTELLCAYLIGEESCFYLKSAKALSQGIMTWFNMYYDDRLSILEKFRDCCNKSIVHGKLLTTDIIPIVFCKFLIKELLSILSAPQWQLLNKHTHLD